jgi:hypothetical protein
VEILDYETRGLPLIVIRQLIKTETDALTVAGTIEPFYEMLDQPAKPLPAGYVELDGRSYKQKDYPELAPLMRPFTGWFTWNVLKRFHVPDRRWQWLVGLDYGIV